jgi:hypothetical protein
VVRVLQCWDETSRCRKHVLRQHFDVKARTMEPSAKQRHTTCPQPACPCSSFSFGFFRLLEFLRVSKCRRLFREQTAPLVRPQTQTAQRNGCSSASANAVLCVGQSTSDSAITITQLHGDLERQV